MQHSVCSQKVSAKLVTLQSERFLVFGEREQRVGTLNTMERMLHRDRLRMKCPGALARIYEYREKQQHE